MSGDRMPPSVRTADIEGQGWVVIVSEQTGETAGTTPVPAGGEPPRTDEGLTDWTIPVVPSVPVLEEDWEWAHRPAPKPPTDISPDQVAAILLVHQAEEWLPATLSGLAALQDRPGVTVAVDMGSVDGSAALLAAAQHDGFLEEVLEAPATEPPGQAVSRAVASLPDDITHLWILHDDLMVSPESLHHMLVEVSRPPQADVCYPTLLRPARRNYPDVIDEQGQTLTSTGSRVLPVIDKGDINQHQSDPVTVLGGSTAGMFLSVAAWRRVGGFDPALPLFRDGVDLGWRANEAGLVVRTAPSCALHHRQAGRGWERDSTLARRPDLTDLLAGMRMVTARSAHPGRTALALFLECIGRALILLLGKAPGRALDELRAGFRLWRTGAENREMAERVRAFRQTCDPDQISSTRRLLPTRRRVWARIADQFAGNVSDRLHPDRDADLGTSIDELTGDESEAREHHTVINPYGTMLVGMLLVGLVAGRGLFGSGDVVSSWLGPAPDGLRGAWAAWLGATPGEPGGNAVWLSISALGSTIAFGQPEIFARAALILSPLLAAMSAHRVNRRIMGLGVPAVLLSVTWAMLPVLTGSIARGSITGLAMGVVIPQLALHMWRLLSPETIDLEDLWGAGGHSPDPWRTAGALAFWTAVAASFTPSIWALAVVGLVGACCRDRRLWRPALLAALGPVVVLGPWLVRVWSSPTRLLTGADPLLTGVGSTTGGLLVLVGGGVSDGAAPLWLLLVGTLPLWLAVLWALTWLFRHPPRGGAPHRSRVLVVAVAIAGLVCFLVAGTSARRLVRLWGSQVHPDVESWQLLGLGCLMVLIAMAWQGAVVKAQAEQTDDELGDSPSLGQLMARWSRKILPVVLIVGMVGNVAWWIIAGAGQPLHRVSTKLPAYVTAVEDSPRRTRTLMILVQDGRTTWNLVDSRSPRWGSGEHAAISTDPAIRGAATQLAQSISAGDVGEDLASQLTALGIGHVWMRGAGDDVVSQVSNASGLTSATADSTSTVWTVNGSPSRARLVTGRTLSPVAETVPAGGSGRSVVILEPRDDRWQVRVGGTLLQQSGRPSGGYGQSYALGGAAGQLDWRMPTQGWAAAIEMGAVLILLIIAGPNASRRAPAPRRSLEVD